MTEETGLRVYTGTSPALSTARRFLQAQHEAIARRLAPFGIGHDRYIALVLTELQKSDQLLEAMQTEKGQLSLMQAVYSMAQLGLEPGPLGHVYLLPFRNRTERFMSATFVLGYRGMIQLAMRSPEVKGVDAKAVYPEDVFDYREGTRPLIDHRPRYDGPPDYDRLTHVYAVCHTRRGGHPFAVLSKRQVEYFRAKSKQPNGEAWSNSPVPMSLKVCVRRGFPFWPVRVQEQQAVDEDERREEMEDLADLAEEGGPEGGPGGGRPPVRAGRDRRRSRSQRAPEDRQPEPPRPRAEPPPADAPREPPRAARREEEPPPPGDEHAPTRATAAPAGRAGEPRGGSGAPSAPREAPLESLHSLAFRAKVRMPDLVRAVTGKDDPDALTAAEEADVRAAAEAIAAGSKRLARPAGGGERMEVIDVPAGQGGLPLGGQG